MTDPITRFAVRGVGQTLGLWLTPSRMWDRKPEGASLFFRRADAENALWGKYGRKDPGEVVPVTIHMPRVPD